MCQDIGNHYVDEDDVIDTDLLVYVYVIATCYSVFNCCNPSPKALYMLRHDNKLLPNCEHKSISSPNARI